MRVRKFFTPKRAHKRARELNERQLENGGKSSGWKKIDYSVRKGNGIRPYEVFVRSR